MHGREPDFEDQNDVIALIELLEISKKKKKKNRQEAGNFSLRAICKTKDICHSPTT